MSFRPDIKDFLIEGKGHLSLSDAAMLMDAWYSCAIEGIDPGKEGFKKIVAEAVKSNKSGEIDRQ